MKFIFKSVFFILGIIILVLIGVLLFYRHSSFSPRFLLSSSEEYTDLFSDSAKENTKLYVTNEIEGRNPISEYVYDDTYSVIVYGVHVPAQMKLDSIIEQGRISGFSPFIDYTRLSIKQLHFYYAHDSIPTVNHIILTLYGDSVKKILKNSGIVSIKLKLNRLFVQFDSNSKADIELGIQKPFSEKIPIEITFIHKKDEVFTVFVSPISNTNSLSDFLPERIFDKKYFDQ